MKLRNHSPLSALCIARSVADREWLGQLASSDDRDGGVIFNRKRGTHVGPLMMNDAQWYVEV